MKWNNLLLTTTVTKTVDRQVHHQTNIFTNFIQSINWNKIIGHAIILVASLILLTLFFLIVNSVGKRIIGHSFSRARTAKKPAPKIEEAPEEATERLRAQGRLKTLETLLQNIFHYVILFFYVYAILSVLGIPVGTLIAGAGIVSVALGLGAKGLVSDIITGLFILIEQQYAVGDTVKIGAITGKVKAVGLRTTQIQASDGTLSFIPNRNISIVNNMSRNNMLALINVYINPQQDIAKMERIISAINADLDLTQYPDIIAGQKPILNGTVDMGNGAIAIQVQIKTRNGAQGKIQRQFLEKYIIALRKAGFDIRTAPVSY
ncbi:mechanosensitive ion channel family protein [Ligilactobacillus sp. LYQ112]|uniref:mechanosensitive ion channel family protein n=1 Tax=Ligilactobacillus sp. LYQ112 TaxID=3391060 RepID=UPI003983AEBB